MRQRRGPTRAGAKHPPALRLALRVLLLLLAVPAAAGAADSYVGHAKLLFAANDVPALRAKLADGGDDDGTYIAIRTWADHSLGHTPFSLLGGLEALHAVGQFGLVAQVEPDGTAYAAKVREIVAWLVHNRAPTSDEFATSLRLQTMALGYDLAYADASAAERDEVRSAMRAYLDYMPLHFNYFCQRYNPYCSNHGMTIGASMGLAAVALWDDVTPSGRDSLAASLAFSDALVQKCLTDMLPADGAYREGVLYGAWIVRMAVPYFEARRRFDGVDFAADPRIPRMLEWLCYELSPDGNARTNNLNDSGWSTRPLAVHATLLEWAQTRFGSGLARYLHDHIAGAYGWDPGPQGDRVAIALWNQPIAAVNPASVLPRSKLFADRGLYYYRSDWMSGPTGDEVVFAFSSGKFYGGHAQEDRNQFTLSAYGRRFAVDCGPVGPFSTPKQTEAHNLVLVDGRGQHNAGNSIGTDATITGSLLSGFADFVCSDAGAAYATYSEFNAPGTPFPTSDWSWGYDGGNPLERAVRTCVVVKDGATPPWFLICDDLRKDASPHAWDWLLHTAQENAIDVGVDPVQVSRAGATCDVYFAHPSAASLALSWAPFVHQGVDPTTARIVAHTYDIEPRFAVALVPRAGGTAAPAYTASDDGTTTALGLDWGSTQDAAVFDPSHTMFEGEVATDGRVALVRDTEGATRKWLLVEGTTLRRDSTELFVSENGFASAVFTGDSLFVSRDDRRFRAWAPGVAEVRGPAGPMSFWRDGDYVQSRLPSDIASPVALRFIAAPEPNPVRSGPVRLRFALGSRSLLRVRVFDARGRLVSELLHGPMPAGVHTAAWSLTTARGGRAAPGVYFVRLESATQSRSAKVVVIR